MSAPIERAVLAWRREVAARPLIVGLCGAQGIGKSSVTALLAERLTARGLRTAILALDDLYLTREVRAELARTVHPLLATRGVPGTHDVALGLRVIEALGGSGPVAVPRFDKAADTRLAEAEWARIEAPVDVAIFEGWCVGAVAQDEGALVEPVNALERDDDKDGRWRRFANAALAVPYAALFGRIDRLVLLAAPGLEVVAGWREEQEAALRRSRPGEGMSAAEVTRFVLFYERLTRWILAEMPGRADLVVRVDAGRGVTEIRGCTRSA